MIDVFEGKLTPSEAVGFILRGRSLGDLFKVSTPVLSPRASHACDAIIIYNPYDGKEEQRVQFRELVHRHFQPGQRQDMGIWRFGCQINRINLQRRSTFVDFRSCVWLIFQIFIIVKWGSVQVKALCAEHAAISDS